MFNEIEVYFQKTQLVEVMDILYSKAYFGNYPLKRNFAEVNKNFRKVAGYIF